MLFGVCCVSGQNCGEDKPGVIKDPDGYVNVRSERSSDSKVITRLPNDTIVGMISKEGEWVSVSIRNISPSVSNPDALNDGFIHASRLVSFDAFTLLCLKSADNQQLFFGDDKFGVIIKFKPTEKDKRIKHDVNYLEIGWVYGDPGYHVSKEITDRWVNFLDVYLSEMIIVDKGRNQIVDVSCLKNKPLTSHKFKIYVSSDKVIYIRTAAGAIYGEGGCLGYAGITIKDGKVLYMTVEERM